MSSESIGASSCERAHERGGEDSILGIVIGTTLLQVLQNLVNLLGIESSPNFAVMGAVILFFGVLMDQMLRGRSVRKD